MSSTARTSTTEPPVRLSFDDTTLHLRLADGRQADVPLATYERLSKATREQLERVHDAGYLDAIEEAAPSEGWVQLDPDTAMNSHTLDAALRAAGAGVWQAFQHGQCAAVRKDKPVAVFIEWARSGARRVVALRQCAEQAEARQIERMQHRIRTARQHHVGVAVCDEFVGFA